MYYGLLTFGLSIFSSLLIAIMIVGNMTVAEYSKMLTTIVGNMTAAETTLPKMLIANAAWLFVILILGGISAGIGGSLGVQAKSSAIREPSSTRPAA
jgi:hypothetical protein